jgi:ubiquinone/menaquinone biosynthesis C-methylase UbiE
MSKELKALYERIPRDGNVLDIGCFGFSQIKFANSIGLSQLKHFGVDYNDYTQVPEGFVFKNADLNKQLIPFDDDQFDLVVASHIIEHLVKPVEFFGDCIRVCKPGGFVHFEAPSERSLFLPGMPFDYDKFFSISFFDDPTHVFRPWTPQSFYRLAKYYQCEPICTGYRVSWKHRILFPLTLIYALLTKNGKRLESIVCGVVGWTSYLSLRKPLELHGKPPFNYYIPNR